MTPSTKAQAAISALKSLAGRIDEREGWAMEVDQANADHIRTLLASVEASEKDAARYRHLRNNCTSKRAARLVENVYGIGMDAAIDTAISSQGVGHG